MLKQLAAAAALSLVTGSAFAVPVGLGGAGDFALLATGFKCVDVFADQCAGARSQGHVGLGSSAHVTGNVGAAWVTEIGSGASVDGDVYYSPGYKPSAGTITGSLNEGGVSYWKGLREDLNSASGKASALEAMNDQRMDIKTSTILHGNGRTSVYDVGDLILRDGHTLTLEGDAGSQFVINVSGAFKIDEEGRLDYRSRGIVLGDGVTPDDVLFNIIGNDFNVASGALAGTFLYSGGTFILGDGLEIADGTHFLGADINGNLQGFNGQWTPSDDGGAGGSGGDIPQPVPAPPAFSLLGLALLGMGGLYGRRMGRLRS